MRVGLTYDLRDDYRAMGFSEEATAEFDSRETIDALTSTLQTQAGRMLFAKVDDAAVRSGA